MKVLFSVLFLASMVFGQCQDKECNPGVEYPYYPDGVDEYVSVSIDSMSGVDCPTYMPSCPQSSCVPEEEEGNGCDFTVSVTVNMTSFCSQSLATGTKWGLGLRLQDADDEGVHPCLGVGEGKCTQDSNQINVPSIAWDTNPILTKEFDIGLCCGTYDQYRMDFLWSDGFAPYVCYFAQNEYGIFTFTCTDCDGEEVEIPE